MAWTTPRTWVDGETVSQSEMNTHVRDNLDYLKSTTDTLTTDVAAKAPLVATVNAKVASYQIAAGDSGEVITMDSGSANDLTVPTGLAAGFTCVVVQLGVGQTTIVASGTTLRSTPGLKLRAQYSAATLIHLGSNVWIVSGDLSA